MTDRSAQNKRIAECVGFTFKVDQWHHPDCECTATHAEDDCKCPSGCYLSNDAGPPDFFTDAAANELLLEAMPLPAVEKHVDGLWSCDPSVMDINTRASVDPDRKTAICEAALKLIEAKS